MRRYIEGTQGRFRNGNTLVQGAPIASRISFREGVIVFERLLPLDEGSVDTSTAVGWPPENV